MERIDVWHEEVFRIKLPLPFPLRWVNSYAIREQDGWTIIDPGLRTDDAIACWMRFFEHTKSSIRDVKQMILTHHHPDHIGLAGFIQELSGAKVMIHPAGMQQAEDLWGSGRPKLDQLLLKLFSEHGLDDSRLEQMEIHMESFIPLVGPLPDASPIFEGDVLVLGDKAYKAIATPGHAHGHISLYDEKNKTMFCGDHVLPRITPNVSYIPDVDDNPLASYLRSLRNMLQYDVNIAYPGHRDPFAAYHERIEEIIQHHHDRLQELIEWTREPKSAIELCERMFGSRLSIHQLRFAISEIIAHLIFLQHEGKAAQIKSEGGIVWKSN